MAVLERSNPLVARFKLRGQAIALLKRSLIRTLTDVEKETFAGNKLLKGISPDSPAEARQLAVTGLEKEQTADDDAIAKEASKVRTDAANKAALANMHAAQQTAGELTNDDLTSKIKALVAEIDAANAKLQPLLTEVARRDRAEQLMKQMRIETDTDKALLHQLLSPKAVPVTTKVGTPGT